MLVTGANRGFGAACVEEFAEAGWDVIAASRSPQLAGTSGIRRVQWDVTDDDTSVKYRLS